MIINKGYKFRIYPTKDQEVFFEQHFNACRFIYNRLLDIRSTSWKEHKMNIGVYDSIKYITTLKQDEDYSWLKAVIAQSLQQAAMHLEQAYQKFFKK